MPRGTNDSGLFYFYDPANWEFVVKVLDGCAINDRYWVFTAAGTDVGYRLAVADTATGETAFYENEPGAPSPTVSDTTAFTGCNGQTSPAAAVASTELSALAPSAVAPENAAAAAAARGGCEANDPLGLCLHDGRYDIDVTWSTPGGESGAARVVRGVRTTDSGVLYFFSPYNWEVLVKVLDGCAVNGHHWVFAASASDLRLQLEIRDRTTGVQRVYLRDPGAGQPAIVDTAAFTSCQTPGASAALEASSGATGQP